MLEAAEGRDCGSRAAAKRRLLNPYSASEHKSATKPVTGDKSRSVAKAPESLFLHPGQEKRYIKIAKKREILSKSKGRCQYPSCNKPSELFHHPNRYSITRNHKSLVDLCKDHHQFMHNGLVENEQANKQNWALNIYKKPDETDQLYRKCRQGALRA